MINYQGFCFFMKWYHLELNQGHTDFQSVALPTELWYQRFWSGKNTFFFNYAKQIIKKVKKYVYVHVTSGSYVQ